MLIISINKNFVAALHEKILFLIYSTSSQSFAQTKCNRNKANERLMTSAADNPQYNSTLKTAWYQIIHRYFTFHKGCFNTNGIYI